MLASGVSVLFREGTARIWKEGMSRISRLPQLCRKLAAEGASRWTGVDHDREIDGIDG
jgi:hypothetical protein